jgi:Macrocin-O-methyltransferase (TylF)
MLGAIKRPLKQIGPLRRAVQALKGQQLPQQRARELNTVLRLSFRVHLNAKSITDDYLFSLKVTDRQCGQVLLVEDALEMVTRNGVKGALVECGVFTGGASAYMLRSALRHYQSEPPAYWGFDSFQGMPHPTPEDGAVDWFIDAKQDGQLVGTVVNQADYESVRSYLGESGYPEDRISLIKGWFQETLPQVKAQIGLIALLRLDGDFYESTRVCLEQLAAQVAPGGIIIFDDYGAFEGCRRAVDEFAVSGFSRPMRFDAHQAFMLKAM